MSRVAYGWKGLDAVTLWEAGVVRDVRGLVFVPYRDVSGAVHNRKVFGPWRRSWWEASGLPLIPFGLELLAAPDERERRLAWIAEGESDALCLRQHYAAWRGRPVDVLGLPGAGTWRSEWEPHVRGYEAVHVFPDGDRAGERMAEAVTRSVRWALVVWLPDGEDVRGLVQRDGPVALDARIEDAEGVSLVLAAMRLNRTLAGARRWLREVTWE